MAHPTTRDVQAISHELPNYVFFALLHGWLSLLLRRSQHSEVVPVRDMPPVIREAYRGWTMNHQSTSWFGPLPA